MTTPQNTLDKRGSQDIQWTGGTPTGTDFPVGCFVTLQCDDVQIITCVQSCSSDTFTGVIEGFKNWNQPEFNGWKNGTTVEFCEQNVFCCDLTAVAA